MLYTGPFEYVLKAPEADGAKVASAGLAANLVALGWVILLCAAGLAAPFVFRGVGWRCCCSACTVQPPGRAGRLGRGDGPARTTGAALLRDHRDYGNRGWAGRRDPFGDGLGLRALVAQVYARLAIFIVAYRAVLHLPPPRTSLRETRRVLGWSEPLWFGPGRFPRQLQWRSSLGAVFSPAASGLYRAGNRVVSALADMFVQPAGLLVTTGLAAERSRGGGGDGAWLRLSGLFGALCWPALAGLAVVADEIAPVLLGPAWAGAGPIIAVFCLARWQHCRSRWPSAVLVIEDRQHSVLWIQSAAALATAAPRSPWRWPAMGRWRRPWRPRWSHLVGQRRWQWRPGRPGAWTEPRWETSRCWRWPTLATLGLAWGARRSRCTGTWRRGKRWRWSCRSG
jgi:hypothetical protein